MRVKKFTLPRTITTLPRHHHTTADRSLHGNKDASKDRSCERIKKCKWNEAMEDKNEATAEVFLSMTDVESRNLWPQIN
jgi:hypothetical protein